ncbi:MAG: hypothetical protein E6J20_06830 [Chloroflexi bacterium]|nr:MAG: hypothetical protein E6J20_06830 [Chloroflexota bacterium]
MSVNYGTSGAISLVCTPSSKTLTVTLNGTPGGSITSVPSGIDCPGTCSAWFANGSTVTLTAHDTTASFFNGWSGDCGAMAGCAVNMAANRAVTAAFGTMYVLIETLDHSSDVAGGNVSGSPGGFNCLILPRISRAVDCQAYFTPGTVVTLSASATTSSAFVWGGDCAAAGTGDCTMTMSTNHSITAVFGLVHDLWPSTGADATNLGEIACAATLTESGTTDALGQHDWFMFTLPAGCGAVFTLADPYTAGVVLHVYPYTPSSLSLGPLPPGPIIVDAPGPYWVEATNSLAPGSPECRVGCGTGIWGVTIRT